jgi:hypothetical protein
MTVIFWQIFANIFVLTKSLAKIIILAKNLCENICFSASFSESMCETGTNARGSLKKLAFLAKFELLSQKQRSNMIFAENRRNVRKFRIFVQP